MSEYQYIEVTECDGVRTVTINEVKILNDKVIEALMNELFDLVARTELPRLLVSFERVGFLSSSVLQLLITLNKRVKRKNGAMALIAMKLEILELFTLTNLTKIFAVRDTAAQGITAIDQQIAGRAAETC